MTKAQTKKQQSPLHFRRIELKYLIPDKDVQSIADRISPYVQLDPFLLEEGNNRTSYPVHSLYFDSIDLHSLKEKDAGLLARRKVRLRTYAESFTKEQLSFLEIKRRSDVVVSKDRLSFSLDQLPNNIPNSRFLHHAIKSAQASKSVVTEAQLLLAWYNLHPTALVQYQRFPFVAINDPTFRITFDRNLKGYWRPSHIFSAPPLHRCLLGYTVLELKFNHCIPRWLHEAIQDYELQRTSCSKYAVIVQSLAPHLALA